MQYFVRCLYRSGRDDVEHTGYSELPPVPRVGEFVVIQSHANAYRVNTVAYQYLKEEVRILIELDDTIDPAEVPKSS